MVIELPRWCDVSGISARARRRLLGDILCDAAAVPRAVSRFPHITVRACFSLPLGRLACAARQPCRSIYSAACPMGKPSQKDRRAHRLHASQVAADNVSRQVQENIAAALCRRFSAARGDIQELRSIALRTSDFLQKAVHDDLVNSIRTLATDVADNDTDALRLQCHSS